MTVIEVSGMSFWNLVFYSWFVFIVLAVFSVVGAAIWESKEEKKRRAMASVEQHLEKAENKEEAPAEAEEPTPEGEPAPEEAFGDLAAPGDLEPLG